MSAAPEMAPAFPRGGEIGTFAVNAYVSARGRPGRVVDDIKRRAHCPIRLRFSPAALIERGAVKVGR